MDHVEATGLQAVERYLLDELSSPERERFEEHLFICAECAEDVRAGAVFTDNLRSVARDAARRPFESPERSGWFARLFRGPALVPSLAAAAFCAVTIVESAIVIPGLRHEVARYETPRAIPAYAIRAASRGEEGAIAVPKNSPSFTIYFDATWKRQSGGYVCQVLDASGAERARVKVPERESGETVTLLLPSSRFASGRYTVVVRGSSSPSVVLGRYEFTLDLSVGA